MKKRIEQKIVKLMNSHPVYELSFEYGNEYFTPIGQNVLLASTKNKCVDLYMRKKGDEYNFVMKGEYCEEEVEWYSSIKADDPFLAFQWLVDDFAAEADRRNEPYMKELYAAIK